MSSALAEILREQRILLREVQAEYRLMRKEMGEVARVELKFWDELGHSYVAPPPVVEPKQPDPLFGSRASSKDYVAMSFAEIGKHLGISAQAAESMCNRGLRKIQNKPEICKRMLELITMRESARGQYVYPQY